MKTFKALIILLIAAGIFYIGHSTGRTYAISGYQDAKVEILKQEMNAYTGECIDEFLITNPMKMDLPDIKIKQSYKFSFPTSEKIELYIPLDMEEFKESNPPPEILPVPKRVTI